MSQHTEEERKLLSPVYRAVFAGTMFFVCLFDFADRSVFTVTAQTIKQELQLSDFQIGILGGFMFALLYSVVGIPIGLLAERVSRIRIVSVCTALWSAATAWCGFAQNFAMFAVGRVGVGLGEAGFMGPANSLNSDLHPAQRRASRMSLILLGTPAGVLAGATLGGWAADPAGLDSWRAAYWILGVGGLSAAVLTFLVLRETPRGLVDGAPKPAAVRLGFFATLGAMLKDFVRFIAVVGSKRALLFVIIGGSLASIGMSSISNFMGIFLERFHQLPAREAGPLFGTISAVSLAIGLLIGSWGTDFLGKADRRWSAWGPAIGLSCAPVIYLFAFSADSIGAATALLIAAGATLLLFYGPTVAMIQNLVPPTMRATGAAFYSMLYAMIGYGFGPPFVGFMSDVIAAARFEGGAFAQACPGGVAPPGSPEALADACSAASAAGVQGALMTAVCVFFFAAVAYLIASRTLRAEFYKAGDEEARKAAETGGDAVSAPKPAE